MSEGINDTVVIDESSDSLSGNEDDCIISYYEEVLIDLTKENTPRRSRRRNRQASESDVMTLGETDNNESCIYLPREKYIKSRSRSESNDNSDSSNFKGRCGVCFDSITALLSNRKKLYSTLCGHIFCQQCIYGVLSAGLQAKCPICRNRVSNTSIHQIFF
ncbi:hypothetical protein GJ496_007295 [Pomphorhynchus laevis]|nr:hypothetical protein GJ496_007295 [Pomphorhynchus laevis]